MWGEKRNRSCAQNSGNAAQPRNRVTRTSANSSVKMGLSGLKKIIRVKGMAKDLGLLPFVWRTMGGPLPLSLSTLKAQPHGELDVSRVRRKYRRAHIFFSLEQSPVGESHSWVFWIEAVSSVFRWQEPRYRGGSSVCGVCGWRNGSQYLGRMLWSGLCSAHILTHAMNATSEQPVTFGTLHVLRW